MAADLRSGVPEGIPPKVRAFISGKLDLPSQKLKENRVRTVWRVDVPSEGPLLVKHYRYLKTYDRFRYRFLPEKAEREARNLDRLYRAGLPVPQALYWERMPGWEAFFVGRFIEGGRPWPAKVSDELLSSLAVLVQRLHAERYLHRDLHVGNLLVVAAELYLLDFHGGRFLPFLPQRWEVHMLALLASSLLARDQLHLVRPFLRRYAGREDERLLREVLDLAARHRRRHLKSRSRRCVVNSTSFAVERKGGTKLFRRRELDAERVEHLLSVGGQVVSSNRRGEVVLFEDGGASWCRKTVRYSRLRSYIARFSPGRLYQAWRGGNALVVHGLGVAKPYAYTRTVSFGALREETLLTEGLVGFQPLTDFLRSIPLEELAQICRPIAVALAFFMTRFHGTRFWQHDLAPKNIMARQRPEGWEFRLVDLDRIWRRGLNRRRILRNLVQLAAVPEVPVRWLDRARFLKLYDGGALWNKRATRELTDGVLREIHKRIVHQSRVDLREGTS